MTAVARASRGRLPARRGYQDQALVAIVDGLAGGGRATVVLACGTGKTLLGVHAGAELVDEGLVVVACPSLALVAQTVKVWTSTGVPDAVLAVCSDVTVADSAVHVSDLECPVTTDPNQIAAWLRETTGARMRLVLVTHLSAGVLGTGLTAAGATADLLLVDEAHRTAGLAGKQSAAVHYDTVLRARRRLYMTATPKVMAIGARGGRAAGLSMDDQDTFGPHVYSYPFAQAIADGWLDDYRVAVIGVTRAEVLRMLHETDANATLPRGGASLRTMVVQAALGKAAVEFGLRRVLVFTSRIYESEQFAATLGTTLAGLPTGYRPKYPLTAVHVDGGQSIAQRQAALHVLADPPQDGWAVVSNARCLSEGVDVPAVDAVVFSSPKGSDIDIVQAVGRALRRNPGGSGIATVLVPVMLPDDSDHAVDDDNEWNRVCQVVRALRAHDGSLGAQLDEHRLQSGCRSYGTRGDGDHSQEARDRSGRRDVGLPTRILIRLPEGYGVREVLQHITVRVLQDTTQPWWEQFGQLRAFQAEHGHMTVPYGSRLASWIAVQRREYRKGILDPERVKALEELGFAWAPTQAAQARGLAAAKAFHATHGHLRVPEDYPSDGIELHSWLAHQRERNRAGKLPDTVKAELDQLGMRWDRLDRVTWDDAYTLAAAFQAEHGHLRTPAGYTVNGFDLYFWLCQQRRDHRKGKLPQARAAALNAIGMDWDLHATRWENNYTAAAAYATREGTLRPSTSHRENGVNVYAWLHHQRRLRREGRLSPEYVGRLNAIGMTW